MQTVMQIGGLVGAQQFASVEVTERRIALAPLRHEVAQVLTDRRERERAERDLVGAAARPGAAGLGVRHGRSRGVLQGRGRDRRDHHHGGVGVAVADGVEETVHGGQEGAQAHGGLLGDVGADLEADEIGGHVPDGARHERVEHRVAREAEIRQM
ncbi:hypothetical protein ACWGLO_26005 [Streptomyces niveus]